MSAFETAAFPAPVLSHEVLAEYSYTNFPWAEIRDWLLPQLAPARRIVLLDGQELKVARMMLADPLFPRAKLVGIWNDVHRQGFLGGVPLLGSEPAVLAAHPDLLLSALNGGASPRPDLHAIHLMARAPLLPNLLLANPYAGSMLIQHDGEGVPFMDPAFPAGLREGIVRHLSRYVFFSGWASGKDVLDVACGNGYGSHLLSRVARSVTAVDLAAHLVEYGRKHNPAPNLRYVCADVAALAGEAQVDLVTSVETFEHIPSDRIPAYVGALRDVLRPDGVLLCTTPFARETVRAPNNREHVAEYSTPDFVAGLSTAFEVDLVVYQDRTGRLVEEVPAGPVPQSPDANHWVQIAVARPRSPGYSKGA